jgi:hypothetical protein
MLGLSITHPVELILAYKENLTAVAESRFDLKVELGVLRPLSASFHACLA